MERLITINNTGRLLKSEPLLSVNLLPDKLENFLLSGLGCVRGRYTGDVMVHFRLLFFYLLLLRLVCVCVAGGRRL